MDSPYAILAALNRLVSDNCTSSDVGNNSLDSGEGCIDASLEIEITQAGPIKIDENISVCTVHPGHTRTLRKCI